MNATRKRDLHTKKKKQVEQNRRGSHTSTSSTTITDDPILVSPPIVKQKFKPVKHNPLKAAASRPPETIAEILYLQRLKNPDSNFYIHHQPPPPPHPVTQSQYPSISRSPNAINRSPTTHRSNQSSSRSSSKSSRGSILAPILPSPLLQRVKQKPKANDFSQTPITLSATTKSLVTRLRDQLRYYAEVEICGRRFLVTKNDQVITNRLRDVKVGDEIKLNRVIELGSKDFTIKGNPYVAEQFYSIKATVLEQPLGPFVVKLKKKPHNRHVKHVTHKQPYTVLRISEVEVNKLI
ncbi:9398_t:CDS:2 [Ambispora leptoticha]|uniref:Large ribosomal subunit protein bL21m n=1 Tax=Ambispora leptoticha TaxID=144679 RepID=A0A9N8WBF6_9GLOM|nr:9398_t:CDS:2 [Ambispora leptoticha]